MAITPSDLFPSSSPLVKAIAMRIELAIDAALRSATLDGGGYDVTIDGREAIETPGVADVLRARFSAWTIVSILPVEVEAPGEAIGVVVMVPCTRLWMAPKGTTQP